MGGTVLFLGLLCGVCRDDECRVVASETERVAHDMFQWYVADAGGGCDAVLHLVLPSEAGGNETVLHGQYADDGLDASRCTRGVPGKRLGARYWWHLVAEDSLQRYALAQVVVGGACTVCIDILYVLGLQVRCLECLFHGEVRSLSVFR